MAGKESYCGGLLLSVDWLSLLQNKAGADTCAAKEAKEKPPPPPPLSLAAAAAGAGGGGGAIGATSGIDGIE